VKKDKKAVRKKKIKQKTLKKEEMKKINRNNFITRKGERSYNITIEKSVKQEPIKEENSHDIQVDIQTEEKKTKT
jgi:hypothetical protein